MASVEGARRFGKLESPYGEPRSRARSCPVPTAPYLASLRFRPTGLDGPPGSAHRSPTRIAQWRDRNNAIRRWRRLGPPEIGLGSSPSSPEETALVLSFAHQARPWAARLTRVAIERLA